MSPFERWVLFLHKWEGKTFVNDPDDTGKETNWGITIRTWNQFAARNGWPFGVPGLKAGMNEDRFRTVAKSVWKTAKADNVADPGVAVALADYAWHGGRFTNGLPTTFQLNEMDACDAFCLVMNNRMAHLQSLSNWWKYGDGWTNRLNDLVATFAPDTPSSTEKKSLYASRLQWPDSSLSA